MSFRIHLWIDYPDWAIKNHGDYTSPLREHKLPDVNLPFTSHPPLELWQLELDRAMTNEASNTEPINDDFWKTIMSNDNGRKSCDTSHQLTTTMEDRLDEDDRRDGRSTELWWATMMEDRPTTTSGGSISQDLSWLRIVRKLQYIYIICFSSWNGKGRKWFKLWASLQQ